MEHGDPKAKANDKVLKNVFRWPWVDKDVGYTDKDENPQTESQGCFIQNVYHGEICDVRYVTAS